MPTRGLLFALLLGSLYPAAAAADVTVYVVDSGVRVTHRALSGTARGRDFVGDAWGRQHGASDCHGHGTAVASLIAGPGVRIVPVRVTDCQGYSPPERVSTALAWVARHAPASALVVASFDVGDATSVREQAEALVARGVPVVAAAGNAVVDACHTAPGGAPHVITVASMDSTRRAAAFSNLGSCIDLFAPGEELRVAAPTSDQATELRSGSSMAAAYVAGVLARRLADLPRSTPTELESWLLAQTDPDVALGDALHESGTTMRGLHAGAAVAAGHGVTLAKMKRRTHGGAVLDACTGGDD